MREEEKSRKRHLTTANTGQRNYACNSLLKEENARNKNDSSRMLDVKSNTSVTTKVNSHALADKASKKSAKERDKNLKRRKKSSQLKHHYNKKHRKTNSESSSSNSREDSNRCVQNYHKRPRYDLGKGSVESKSAYDASTYEKAFGVTFGNFELLSLGGYHHKENSDGLDSHDSRKLTPASDPKRFWECPKCSTKNYQTNHECHRCRRLRGHY